MFSLQQIFGKGDRFLELLIASAEEAHESVRLLIQFLNASSDGSKQNLEGFIELRRKEKRIAEQISEELVRTFITGLEREDIEALSHALYKIPKSVEKFAERFEVSVPVLAQINFASQAEMLEKATGAVVQMVRQLKNLDQLEDMRALSDQLQQAEGEADKRMTELLRDLYSGRHETLTVVVAKDLYELMEKIIDRCRNAGNVALQIVLKNS